MIISYANIWPPTSCTTSFCKRIKQITELMQTAAKLELITGVLFHSTVTNNHKSSKSAFEDMVKGYNTGVVDTDEHSDTPHDARPLPLELVRLS